MGLRLASAGRRQRQVLESGRRKEACLRHRSAPAADCGERKGSRQGYRQWAGQNGQSEQRSGRQLRGPMPAQQTPNTIMLPVQYREAAITAGSLDAEARTFDILWTAGAEVARVDWWSGER